MVTVFGQKFTTTQISGGCRICVKQHNPLSGGGKGSIPTKISIKLYEWDTNYTTTLSNGPLVYDFATIASEEIESDNMWVFLFWKPLSAGTYLWLITVWDGDLYGTFQILRDTRSTYKNAYEDGINVNYDFYSEILFLESEGESYEKILSYADTFSGSYIANNGHSNPKINNNTVNSPNYVDSIYAQDPVTKNGRKAGRIATGSLIYVNN